VERILSEVSFAGRQSALKQKKKTHEQILPFVTAYHPGVKNLKKYFDAQMEFNYYNIQERLIAIKRHARESKALKAQ